MAQHDDNLFQIGEVTKILGISRKTILNYEDLGLITPAVKKEGSGYRYYTADNIVQIRSIRSLQSLGLSLKEVAAYYYDTANLDECLSRLENLRSTLDRSIQNLQVRTAKAGDMTVHAATLARQVCFCREFRCTDVEEGAARLRETYVAAAHTGLMSQTRRMFVERTGNGVPPLRLLCCIPMEEGFEGPERREFPETRALCIYHRGPYEKTIDAFRALARCADEREIEAAGDFRAIYLEGPPSRGADSANYITQVALPVTDLPR